MEVKEMMEAGRGFYKMGFGIAKTTLDLMKVSIFSFTQSLRIRCSKISKSS
ncbi:MAG: hypothetical protein PWQ22_1466 [Archaeoglobaceae archaeon]|nr:hypothetical protein [Archaeoglobaceae archaeon]